MKTGRRVYRDELQEQILLPTDIVVIEESDITFHGLDAVASDDLGGAPLMEKTR